MSRGPPEGTFMRYKKTGCAPDWADQKRSLGVDQKKESKKQSYQYVKQRFTARVEIRNHCSKGA